MGRAYKQVSIQYNCTKFYSFTLLISCYKTDYRGLPAVGTAQKSIKVDGKILEKKNKPMMYSKPNVREP